MFRLWNLWNKICSTSNFQTSLINLLISIWSKSGNYLKRFQQVQELFFVVRISKNFFRLRKVILQKIIDEFLLLSFSLWMEIGFLEQYRFVTILSRRILENMVGISAMGFVQVRDKSDMLQKCFLWHLLKLKNFDSKKYCLVAMTIILLLRKQSRRTMEYSSDIQNLKERSREDIGLNYRKFGILGR